MGTNLISFDKASFTSFGLQQGENASISAVAELKIRSALNDLIQRGLRQNDIVHLHWTRKKDDVDPADLLETADEEAVRNLLDAPRTGQCQPVLDTRKYYAMSLSGNGGRIIVRDWLESTVPRGRAERAGNGLKISLSFARKVAKVSSSAISCTA